MKNLRNNTTAVKTVIINVCILFKRVACGLASCVSFELFQGLAAPSSFTYKFFI